MKKFLTWFALGAVLIVGIVTAIGMGTLPRTYEPANGTSVYDLYNDPSAYEETEYSGAADAIVQQNLDKSRSVNDVTSIVFDFRGYDTMGESFILLTAVAGSMVILANHKKKEEKEGKKDE